MTNLCDQSPAGHLAREGGCGGEGGGGGAVKTPSHLDGVHRGSEDRVVVLDAPPVARPAGTGQVTAVFLQDAQGLDQPAQGPLDLRDREPFATINDH